MTVPDLRFPQSLPKAPKRKREKRPWLLLLLALLLFGAAAAAYIYPIPGLTAPQPGAEQNKSAEPPVQTQPMGKDPQAEREAALATKEVDLAEREAALKEREAKVNDLLKELTVQQSEAETTRRISAIYAAMSPVKAAPLLEALDSASAAQVLRLLSEEQSAAILGAMQTDKAAAVLKEMAKPPTR